MTLQTEDVSTSTDKPTPQEGLKLVQAFLQISDPAKRREALALVQALAEGQPETDAS